MNGRLLLLLEAVFIFQKQRRRNGVRRKSNSSDPCHSNPVELLTLILTPFFEFHFDGRRLVVKIDNLVFTSIFLPSVL